MMYGKRLTDAFHAEARAFLSRNEYAEAGVMDAMESAVNNVMHGRPAAEIRERVIAHVGRVLDDSRIVLYESERAAYGYALDIIESVPTSGS